MDMRYVVRVFTTQQLLFRWCGSADHTCTGNHVQAEKSMRLRDITLEQDSLYLACCLEQAVVSS